LRAALGIAKRWKYLPEVPEIPKVKGIETEKRFVTEPHFEAMLKALEQEPCPVYLPFSGDHGGTWTAAEWWRALLVTVWVTGMRKGALLALQWEDVDLKTGRAVSRGQDNKGKRPHPVKLGPVIPLLLKIKGDDPRVFPCDHWKTTFDDQFRTLQVAAEIVLPCVGSDTHECTRACHCYCFHDFRRAHATYHYGEVTDRELQQQMGHAAFSTTQGYIKYAQEHAEKQYAFKMPAAAQAAVQGLKLVVHDGGPQADSGEIALQKKKA
jgi:integrase